MKKKYEKPEMIMEIMSLDMLQMVCTEGHASTNHNVKHLGTTCTCCIKGKGSYALGST